MLSIVDIGRIAEYTTICKQRSMWTQWGPLDPSNLKQNLSKSVCIFTSFQKFTRFTKTSTDLNCDKTWIQICTQNDDVTSLKSRLALSFASGYS